MDPDDLQELERLIAARFPVYESRFDPLEGVAVFLVTVEDARLEEDFDQLKSTLDDHDLIPMLREEGGEHMIYVVGAPDDDYTKPWVNAALFFATIATTILAGAFIVRSYWIPGGTGLEAFLAAFTSPKWLGQGALLFALPLMATLGIHELGHYFTAKWHDVEASLPFFIPIPPGIGFPIGTMGAFISIRRPITDRKALFDIGISGPLAGLVVAIPVTLIGSYLGAVDPQFIPEAASGNFITLGGPIFGQFGGPRVQGLLFSLLQMPFPSPDNAIIHPTAFAGWVGLLVTGLNLLPVGQLDGGHIFRAVLGEPHKYASIAGVGALLVFGAVGFSGWLVFALLILILGTYHPPPLNDISELSDSRKALAVLALILLIVTFVPIPFYAPGG